jgi:acyl-CoA synthetase (AMP-forming)/AMP-acid ligase II
MSQYAAEYLNTVSSLLRRVHDEQLPTLNAAAARIAECIISGGVNIYPARIDETLATAPGVLDGAAFGLPDEEFGEIVAAAIVLAFGADPEKAIETTIAFCKEQLGSQLTPKRIFVVDELPRSDAGKLYRSRLVQQFTEA